MKCPRCGTEIDLDASFCRECGLRLDLSSQMNQAAEMHQNFQTAGMNQNFQTAGMNQNFQTAPSSTGSMNKKKRNRKPVIITISIVMVLLLIGAGSFFVWKMSDDKSQKTSGKENVSQNDDREDDDGNTDSKTDTDELKEEKAEHTIMIYMVGSDLEHNNSFGSKDIDEIMDADYGDNTRIVLQTGGCKNWRKSEITDGEVERWEISGGEMVKLESLGKMSMLRTNSLADFITFSADNYPAENYSLVLWDHGGGIPVGFGYDEVYPNDTLYAFQIGKALKQAGVDFECIVFDACNMCTLEVAMAIKDYANYMVAAESYVVGNGMDYTSWLDCYEDDDFDYADSYEELAEAYMESVEVNELVGSISIIDLGKVEKVYDAYLDYISAVHEEILNGGYSEYILARENCGLYTNTESVDIITLATMYPVDCSADLINATVNAVCYTESDYAFGHGLAVYNPSEYLEYYDYVRKDLVALKYDDEIMECYDDVVSIGLSYNGTSYVECYAGDWYNADIVDEYAGSNYEPEEYSLTVTQMGGYQAIMLSDDDWEIVTGISTSVLVQADEDFAYVLGEDFVYSLDENDYVIVEKPQLWTFVNDNVACYIVSDYWEDQATGQWTQTGGIVALCNGEPILMFVYYDDEHPEGTVLGYCEYDFLTEEGDSEFLQFADDDIIEIVLPCISGEEGGDYYANLSGESFYASDLELSFDYIDLSSENVAAMYTITDVYENIYTTEWIGFGE
ncbi:MAG: clostripain-related cysteine peptidase [Lachnospiraceae bacterium]